MVRKTTLQNGLRVVAKKLDSTKAVTVLVLAGAGSRYETIEINGIAHFLEHMFFKGAKKYKNSQAVADAIDGAGGDFNAFTGKEYAGYYIKVASAKMDLAFDVLADMLLHATFLPEEIEKERGVILEEFNMYQDTPMYQIGWNFERLMFGDQPMGWDQIGTKELIKSVTQAQFFDFKRKLYTPDNTVVAVVGNIDYDDVIAKCEKYFAFEKSTKHEDFKPLAEHDELYEGSTVFLTDKKTEQAHTVVGVRAYAESDERYYAEKVLATILGGNMSSRMFMSVREAQGLCYYISTSTDDYTDAGIVSTRAGVDLNRIDDAIIAICREYAKIASENVPDKELKKGKEYLKGKLTLRLEDSEEFAHLISKKELLYGKPVGPDEIFKRIDSVSAKDVRAVAEDIFAEKRLRVAVIGPYDDRGRFEKALHF